MNLNIILLESHSGIRWLVVLAALVLIVKYIIGLSRNTRYSKLDGQIWTVFSMLFRLQWVLGLIFFIYRIIIGGFLIQHVFHLLIMTAALGLLEMAGSRFKGTYRNLLLAVVGALVLVFVGVVVLPAGMARWTM